MQDDALPALSWIRIGNSRQQRLGVRVSRGLDDLACRADLHDLSKINDGNAIGDMPHHRDVVRDEQ